MENDYPIVNSVTIGLGETIVNIFKVSQKGSEGQSVSRHKCFKIKPRSIFQGVQQP
jgi:hypothetical protein